MDALSMSPKEAADGVHSRRLYFQLAFYSPPFAVLNVFTSAEKKKESAPALVGGQLCHVHNGRSSPKLARKTVGNQGVQVHFQHARPRELGKGVLAGGGWKWKSCCTA